MDLSKEINIYSYKNGLMVSVEDITTSSHSNLLEILVPLLGSSHMSTVNSLLVGVSTSMEDLNVDTSSNMFRGFSLSVPSSNRLFLGLGESQIYNISCGLYKRSPNCL